MLFLTIDEFESKDKIYINKSTYSPAIKAHSHKFLEIVYVYNGSGGHVINGVTHNASKGSLFFLNYNVEHCFTGASDDFAFLNCVFLPSVIDENLSDIDDAQALFHCPLFDIFPLNTIDFTNSINFQNMQYGFENILFTMNDEYVEKKAGYQTILQNYLTVLLTMIFRMASGIYGERIYNKNKSIVNKAREYIDSHYQSPLTLNGIAERSYLSPSQFSVIFKSVMGYSLFDYIHRVRVTEACAQLLKTDKNIKDIMSDVGYSDAKYFYRVFKQYTTKTPGEYRKNGMKQ